MYRDKIGVIHGRFQGLHNGHVEYLLAGKSRCEHLVIGITNFLCNAQSERISSIDNHRLTAQANPFTYFERMEMIRLALLENNVKESEFSIVPFSIEQPEQLFNFTPKNAVYYITIYDDWGREKLRILKELKLNVDVMWERAESQKPVSGTLVRAQIRSGENWEQFVPKSVAQYIKAHGLEEAVRNNA